LRLRPPNTNSRAPTAADCAIEISNNDAWVRDTGPTFVVNAAGRRRAVDWQFNAWGGLDGGLYFPWDQDDLVAQKLAAVDGVDRYRAPLVMEGAPPRRGQGTLPSPNVPAESPQPATRARSNPCCASTGATRSLLLGESVINDETDGQSTTWPASRGPGRCASRFRRTGVIRSGGFQTMRWSAWLQRAMRGAGGSRYTSCQRPARCA
jgi:agmatine/peptidylarginine deiminase